MRSRKRGVGPLGNVTDVIDDIVLVVRRRPGEREEELGVVLGGGGTIGEREVASWVRDDEGLAQELDEGMSLDSSTAGGSMTSGFFFFRSAKDFLPIGRNLRCLNVTPKIAIMMPMLEPARWPQVRVLVENEAVRGLISLYSPRRLGGGPASTNITAGNVVMLCEGGIASGCEGSTG